ncbi:hypothetical protein S83_028685 [Arachis hypogaea]
MKYSFYAFKWNSLYIDITLFVCLSSQSPSYGAIVVFNLNKSGNIEKAIKGERVGTLIGATWNSTISRT